MPRGTKRGKIKVNRLLHAGYRWNVFENANRTPLRRRETVQAFLRYGENGDFIMRNSRFHHISRVFDPFLERMGALESPDLSLSNAPKHTQNGAEMGEL